MRGKSSRPPSGGKRKAKAIDALPSKRRGKPLANEVYEAEESDPDEVKHAARYDRVDNFEYEMPSDFEDEEIDEELAFTEEDKKKYAGWFDDGNEPTDEGDEEEEGGHDTADKEGDSDVDLALLDSDAEVEDEHGAGDKGTDEDDELPGFGHEDEAEDADDDGDAVDQLGDEEELYMSMLQAVVGSKAAAAPDGSSGQPSTASKRKAKQADAQATVLTEAYPEAEFNLNPGAASAGLSASGELSVADLIKGLGNEGRRKLAPAARKMLEKMAAGAKAVAAPLPRTIKERTERRAGYETTSKEVSKWQPLVKANREAPTLRFTAARDEVPHVNTTAALVAQHVPEGDMEAEVAALLQAAGAATTKAVAEAEQALSLKALSVEEAAERRERLAKMRSLLFYHELKAKRMKAIKSKEFHRKAAKAAKRKGQRHGLGQGMEEGGEREAQEAQEFERAKERLTLKHRNTSRWARRALKRGATILDPGTKAAVAEQLQLGEALKRKIEGQAGSDEEDSGSSSSGEDEGEGRGQAGGSKGSKARAAALEVLQGSDPAHPAQPVTKGLLSLPFMARALERQRLEAEQQARALLAELDEEGGELDAAGTGSGPLGSSAAHGGTGLGPGVTGAMGRLRFGGVSATSSQPDGKGLATEEEGGQRLGSEEDDEGDEEEERLEEGGQGLRRGKSERPNSGALGDKAALQRAPSAADQADLDQALLAGPGALHALAPLPLQPPQSQRGQRSRRRGQGTAPASALAAPPSGAVEGGGALPAQLAHLFDKQPTGSRLMDGLQGPGQPAQLPAFIPAKTHAGGKQGYVFTKGAQGLGYYLDAKQLPSAPSGKAVPSQPYGHRQAAAGQSRHGAASSTLKLHSADRNPQAGASDAVLAAMAGGAAQSGGEAAAEGMVPLHGGSGSVVPGSGKLKVDGEAEGGQLALIRAAFVGDDVEQDFEAEKAAEVAAELPKEEVVGVLPGWGVWANQQKEPRWVTAAREKAAREREKAAASRADAALKFVVLSEKWDKKAMTKYSTQSVPFPFDSKDTYERSMRQPLGRQYNADSAFRDLTRPAVLKNTGVVIEPIRYTKPVAQKAEEVAAKQVKAKVLTVAGGMFKQPKKRQQ